MVGTSAGGEESVAEGGKGGTNSCGEGSMALGWWLCLSPLTALPLGWIGDQPLLSRHKALE